MMNRSPSQSLYAPVALLVLVTASILACSTGQRTVQPKPSVGLVAQGESFSGLTVITENLANCDESSTGTDGKIVFSCTREGHWDLYMKSAPTGGAVQRLTVHGGQDINPAISPDGSRVAFASNRSGNYDIFIMGLNGGTAKQQVTDNKTTDFAPTWSPDGKMLAYTRIDPMDKKHYIWIKNLETNANIQLGQGFRPRFRPDGKTILFQKLGDVNNPWVSLWTMNMNGSQLTQIVSSQEWGAIDADWSPDGQKLIFVSSKGNSGKFIYKAGAKRVPMPSGNNIWTVNANGSNLTQLTTHPKDDILPTWSADNFIYFTSWRDGKKRIWRFVPVFPDNYTPMKKAPLVPATPATPAKPAVPVTPEAAPGAVTP